MNIIQIVPALPPSVDGLGDYSMRIASVLREKYSIESMFIVSDPTWNGNKEIEGFTARRINKSKIDLLSVLKEYSCPVVLHYVGYGYAHRGCPFWLIDGLRKWKAGSVKLKLITFFHEIYARGPVWSSAFWLSPVQKNLAKNLIELSNLCLTSKESYSSIIEALSGGAHSCVRSLSVFSNIGEPSNTPTLVKRERLLVVFGRSVNRERVYGRCLDKLIRVCRELGIVEIVDIGPKIKIDCLATKGIKLSSMGVLKAEEVSQIMLNATAGFLDYNPLLLGKSGIFAAYCAHGLLPINATCYAVAADGVKLGEEYWSPEEGKSLNLEQAQIIADNASEWYKKHNIAAHAQVFAELAKTYR